MVDKKSAFYVKSEFESGLYGSKDSTTFERSLRVEGKDRDQVKYTAVYVESRVM